MTIHNIETSQLAAIIAGLVQQGLTFDAHSHSVGLWTITLTGGF
ncbi:hypothetical protein UFOVP143_32 [uncultured Caudovirales phage]|uniref:Uncharacterized protein n=1 Tax=uncultured Caudovirales phage TaxID=2100421 RepID=A0A6J7VJL8_9CAUD|nr:hypothetical protein UFOVP143_32 [uncultured Caudovirales phage]